MAGGGGGGVARLFRGGQPLSLGSSQNASAQIESDILQIDSILKALNTGNFDAANMRQISELTGSAPTNVQVLPCTCIHVFMFLYGCEECTCT